MSILAKCQRCGRTDKVRLPHCRCTEHPWHGVCHVAVLCDACELQIVVSCQEQLHDRKPDEGVTV